MNIYKAKVTSTEDFNKAGNFLAIVPEYGTGEFSITYTSPFYSVGNHGILAIPFEGSEILVACDTNGIFYYMSTVVGAESIGGGVKDFSVIGDQRVYGDDTRPRRVTMTNANGAGVVVTRRYKEDSIVDSTVVKSSAGKKLSLDDSPEIDSVILRNQHGDGLTITADTNSVKPERGVELKSLGPQKFVSFNGDINIKLFDGREIEIENSSTGSHANFGENRKYGNIRFITENGDLALISRSNDGRVFLITPNARIQIESDGTVRIESSNLVIDAEESITLQARDINLNAQNTIVTNAAVTNINSQGNTNIEGAQVHLNSGLGSSDIPTPSPTELTSYEE